MTIGVLKCIVCLLAGFVILAVCVYTYSSRRKTSLRIEASGVDYERDGDMKYTEIEIEKLGDSVPMQETIRRHNEMVEEKAKAMWGVLDGAHNPQLAEYCTGGWGYSKDSAVKVNLGDDVDGIAQHTAIVNFECQFAERRIYEELRMYGDVEGRKIDMHCIRRGFLGQSFRTIDGRAYDVLNYIVTGFPEEKLEMLEKDYEDHGGYMDDPDGLCRHEEMADKWRIGYEAEYWFDITMSISGLTNE